MVPLVNFWIRGEFGEEDRDQLLPKRLRNTMNTMLSRSNYHAFDFVSGNVGRLVSPTSIMNCEEALGAVIEELGLTREQIGPILLSSLDPLTAPYTYCKHTGKALAEVSERDLPLLVELAVRQKFNPEVIDNVAVRTVFGASERYPLRALSYLLPALHFVEGIRRSGMFSHLPEIQFCFMNEAGGRVNELDRTKVTQQTELFINLLFAFINQRYPEIADKVLVATDDNFMDNPIVQSHYRLLLSQVDLFIDPFFQNVFSSIYKGKKTALEYALLHPLVHDITFPDNLFQVRGVRGKMLENPSLLINIGAQTEKPFYRFRQIVKVKMAESGLKILPSVQLFSSHRVTPYYLLENDGSHLEDIPLDSALQNPSLISDSDYRSTGNILMARDLELLAKEGLNTADFLFSIGKTL